MVPFSPRLYHPQASRPLLQLSRVPAPALELLPEVQVLRRCRWRWFKGGRRWRCWLWCGDDRFWLWLWFCFWLGLRFFFEAAAGSSSAESSSLSAGGAASPFWRRSSSLTRSLKSAVFSSEPSSSITAIIFRMASTVAKSALAISALTLSSPSRSLLSRFSDACATDSKREKPKKPQVPLIVCKVRKIRAMSSGFGFARVQRGRGPFHRGFHNSRQETL